MARRQGANRFDTVAEATQRGEPIKVNVSSSERDDENCVAVFPAQLSLRRSRKLICAIALYPIRIRDLEVAGFFASH